MSQLFSSGGQSIGASTSAKVLPMNIQGWFPLGLTGFIFLQSKKFSRVFSSTTVGKHHSSVLSLLYGPPLNWVQLTCKFDGNWVEFLEPRANFPLVWKQESLESWFHKRKPKFRVFPVLWVSWPTDGAGKMREWKSVEKECILIRKVRPRRLIDMVVQERSHRVRVNWLASSFLCLY